MKNGINTLFIILFFSFRPSFGQTIKKIFSISSVAVSPRINGTLDEPCWKTGEPAINFIQINPNPGQVSKMKTAVSIVYDNTAVYIGAMMYDNHPDSINRTLTMRDGNNDRADYFGIAFDTYHDGQNAFAFFVTAAGVQSDAKFTGSGFDDAWDGVWESGAEVNDSGWVAEIKIPFSALRFSNEPNQRWGINMIRSINRYRESSSWNPFDPQIEGNVSQFGILQGIEKITPPVRFALYPHISANLRNFKNSTTTLLNAGADLKYGISESFTLDAMLIPDFGQVRSDDVVLNLTPFEVQYQEQRQFFTEGTELFQRGDIFYSRRIGGTPVYYYDIFSMLKPYEVVRKNPPSPQLYNATKISGRTKSKLGIGLLNATVAGTYAEATDTMTGEERKILTNPLSNYNIIVFDKALPDNSYISFINSNVMRDGSFRDANVTGTEFKILNEENSYSVDGTNVISQKFMGNSNVLGHRMQLNASKVKGNFTTRTGYSEISDTYDHNDMGYLRNNNERSVYSHVQYNIYTPFWKILSVYNNAGAIYNRLYFPSAFTDVMFYGNNYTQFKNFLSAGFWFGISPFDSYDYYEPHTPGRFYLKPEWNSKNVFFSTNNRKQFSINVGLTHAKYNETGRHSFSYYAGPKLQLGTKFLISWFFSKYSGTHDVGFAGADAGTIFFGRRNVATSTGRMEVNYIFTRNMSLSARLRHYWSKAGYDRYYYLKDDGTLEETVSFVNADVNFTAFNIDLTYTWQFAPGSEILLVWKNQINDSGNKLDNSFSDNIQETFRNPQSNTFSLKILYYMDYNSIIRKKTI